MRNRHRDFAINLLLGTPARIRWRLAGAQHAAWCGHCRTPIISTPASDAPSSTSTAPASAALPNTSTAPARRRLRCPPASSIRPRHRPPVPRYGRALTPALGERRRRSRHLRFAGDESRDRGGGRQSSPPTRSGTEPFAPTTLAARLIWAVLTQARIAHPKGPY